MLLKSTTTNKIVQSSFLNKMGGFNKIGSGFPLQYNNLGVFEIFY